MENKHYIRLNNQSQIIKGFSDAFEEPLETDTLISKEAGRHFELNGVINPALSDENGAPLFKYQDGEIVGTTAEERAPYIPAEPDPDLTLEERIAQLEILYLKDSGVIV